VFDRSANTAEHFSIFLLAATHGYFGQFLAIGQLFGTFRLNTWPTGMRTAIRGTRSVGTATMIEGISPPLALRPRYAAKALGISERLLWQLTKDGHVPCVRVGNGKRQTVLYPVADLQAWLTHQAEAAKGGDR